MCGICGEVFIDGAGAERGLLASMMDTIRHRGPDDHGMYVSGPAALGHRRLSIIDLDSGHQPISNEDGSVCVVFNGEIYNYRALRSDLESRGHVFRTATDTEVIVHSYEELGERCVERFWGMFAFALWDERNRALLLARDRVGIKPLYYAVTPRSLIFASEVKAILAEGSVPAEADPEALASFLRFNYVPGEKTLFKTVKKLKPGHFLKLQNGSHRIAQYWDLSFRKGEKKRNYRESVAELDDLLRTSVRDHMISDVPVGVLLSGGVDSTAMLGYAVEHTKTQLSTFTIGFDAPGISDERPYAKLAAQRFGSQHYEMTISAGEFLDFLPRYVWHMEEPVCEPPAVALYYVSKMAREHVTVLLSGEGGDEAFAGYQNYRNAVWMERFKLALGPLARPASRLLRSGASLAGLPRVAHYAPLINVPFEQYYYSRTSGPLAYFNRYRDDLCTPEFNSQVHGADSVLEPFFRSVDGAGLLNKMLYVDTKTWLPDDLLIKADKMTMANSLELRVPLLDHRVLEFAASLPAHYKLSGFRLKHILKDALADKVPDEILNRPKAGFPVPYASWLRHDLKETIEEVLTDRKALERGYFRKEGIRRLIERSRSDGRLSTELFSLLTLELWHRTFVDCQERVLL